MNINVLGNIHAELYNTGLTTSDINQWAENFFNDEEARNNVHQHLLDKGMTNSDYASWMENITGQTSGPRPTSEVPEVMSTEDFAAKHTVQPDALLNLAQNWTGTGSSETSTVEHLKEFLPKEINGKAVSITEAKAGSDAVEIRVGGGKSQTIYLNTKKGGNRGDGEEIYGSIYEAQADKINTALQSMVQRDVDRSTMTDAERRSLEIQDLIDIKGYSWNAEEHLVDPLQEILGPDYTVEQDNDIEVGDGGAHSLSTQSSSDIFGNHNITVTNKNGIPWVGSLGAGTSKQPRTKDLTKFKDGLNQFLKDKPDAESTYGPEWVAAKKKFDEEVLTEEFESLDKSAILDGRLTEQQAVNKVKDSLGYSDPTSRIGVVGLAQKLNPFGEEKRTDFKELSDKNIENAIKDKYHSVKQGEKERSFYRDEIGFAERLASEDYMYTNPKTGEETLAKDEKEFFALYRQGLISTFEDGDEANLATANMQLLHGNLDDVSRAEIIKQRDISIQKLKAKGNDYKMFIDYKTGNMVRRSSEGGDAWDQGENIEGEIDAKIAKLNGELTEEGVSHFDLTQGRFEKNAVRLSELYAQLKEVHEYRKPMGAKKRKELGIPDGAEAWDKVDYTTQRALDLTYGHDGYTGYVGAGEMINSDSGPSQNDRKLLRQKLRELQIEQEALKRMYLLNEDITSVEKSGWQDAAISLAGGFKPLFGGSVWDTEYKNMGQDYRQKTGEVFDDISRREILTGYTDILTTSGLPLTAEAANYNEVGFWQGLGETGVGTVGVLAEFALANKATAALRSVKLFSKGTKSLNAVLNARKEKRVAGLLVGQRTAKTGKFIKSKDTVMTYSQVEVAAAKVGMTPKAWRLKYLKNATTIKASPWARFSVGFTESGIEGLKFAALPSSSGDRMGAFATGFGFGAAGQILGPMMGGITQSSFKGTGTLSAWLRNNSTRINTIYQLGIKGPTNFLVGSELGEATLALADDYLGSGEDFGDFWNEHYGDMDENFKRMAGSYLMGVGLGLTHGVPAWKQMDGLRKATAQAEGKYIIRPTEHLVKNLKTGEVFSPSSLSNYKSSKFEILYKKGEVSLRKTIIDSKTGKERPITKEELVNFEELHLGLASQLKRAERSHDRVDDLLATENMRRDAAESMKKMGELSGVEQVVEVGSDMDFVEGKVEIGVDGKMKTYEDANGVVRPKMKPGRAPSSAEVYYVDKKGNKHNHSPGKESLAKVVYRYNVERFEQGLVPHEVGHSGMAMLFGANARIKAETVQQMLEIAEKVDMGRGETLRDQMAERYNKIYKKENVGAAADKVFEWELFSHLAQELAKPKNFDKLKKAGAFSKYKELIKQEMGDNLGHTYNLKTHQGLVDFFGNYIESINKGKNPLEALKHLEDVIISESESIEGAKIKEAYEKAGVPFDVEGLARLQSSSKADLIAENMRLLKEKPEGWEAKKDANVLEIARLKDALTIERAPEDENLNLSKKDRDRKRKERVNLNYAKSQHLIHDKTVNPKSREGRFKGQAEEAILNSYRNAVSAVVQKSPKKAEGKKDKARIIDTPTIVTGAKSANMSKLDYAWEITKPVLKQHLDTFNRAFREGNKDAVRNDDLDAWMNSYIPEKLGTAIKKPENQIKEFDVRLDDVMGTSKEPSYTMDTDMSLNVKTDARLKIDIRNRITNEATPERNKEIEQGVKELNDFITEFIKNKPSADVPSSYAGLKNIKVPKTILDKVFGKNTKQRIETIAKTLDVAKKSAIPQGTLSTRTGSTGIEGKSLNVANTLQTVNIAEPIKEINPKTGKTENVATPNYKEVLYGTPKRTAEFASKETGRLTAKADPTGQGNAPKELLKLSRTETLKRIGIKEVELGGGEVEVVVDDTLAKEYASEPGAKSVEKIMANMVNIRKNYMEEVVRGMTYQAAMEAPNLSALAKKLGLATEVLSNQIGAGKPRLASEEIGRIKEIEDQMHVIRGMGTKEFKALLESKLRAIPKLTDDKKYIKAREKAVEKTFKEYFNEYKLNQLAKGERVMDVSAKDLATIGRQLQKQFKFSEIGLLQKALVKRAEMSIMLPQGRAIENMLGLPETTISSVSTKETLVEVTEALVENFFPDIIRKEGIEAIEVMFGGFWSPSGILMHSSKADLMSGTNKGTNRLGLFENVEAFNNAIELAVKGIEKGKMGKDGDWIHKPMPRANLPGYTGPSKALSNLVGNSKALQEALTMEKRPGIRNRVQRKTWNLKKLKDVFEAAEYNKKVLNESIEVVRDLYQNGNLSQNAARLITENWFSQMQSLGKKSSSPAGLPDMPLAEMIKEFGEMSPENYVLEHMTTAKFTKERVYEYILTPRRVDGKINPKFKLAKQNMESTIRDSHTTIIPKSKDTMVNKTLQEDMGIDFVPEVSPIVRYWSEVHQSKFDFGLKIHHGRFKGNVYGRSQTMTDLQQATHRKLHKQAREDMLPKALQSESLSSAESLRLMKNLDQAIGNTRKKAKRKGMSTWDFDDTLAHTKSGVGAKIPNPSGLPKPGRKVIFMAGGAGSGKGNVIGKLGLEKAGYKIVNSDISLEWLKKNNGLPEKQGDYTAEQRSSLSKLTAEARKIAKRKQGKFAGDGNGVVVDGTGGSVKAMKAKVQEFKDKGYDVSMVFVETSLEVAQQRNAARTTRSLREGILNKNHEQVQGNKESFRELFGENFNEVLTDNIGLKDALPKEFKDKVDKFTNSYENRRLDAEEFAIEGAEIKERGGEFDFSEFNKVVGGEKGPMFKTAFERAKKFGTDDTFILTARSPESAPAIKEFLDSQGLEIPLKNIIGLGNSTSSAKARWMIEKFAEGYNDMYFADDVMQNVKAVKEVLDQLDIKSNVQQAVRLQSEALSSKFNEMIERKSGIGAEKVFSGAKGKMLGRRRWSRSLVVPGAQDFMGLMQNFIGKGEKGNADRAFFDKHLGKPFARAHKEINEARQKGSEDLKALYKHLPSVKKKLDKNLPDSPFTYDQAIRTYLWKKAGIKIPGLSVKDAKLMTDIVKGDPDLVTFAESLHKIGRGSWVKPGESWVAETIVSDIFNLNKFTKRAEYMQEWQQNVDVVFSKDNMNKIEATQGSKFREALEDSLYRMKTGSNRPTGANRLQNTFTNFINGSVGATMFLNMKSALFQTISATNYMNWGFNNPAAAAKAFANQPQYWKDFSMLWNSPMLKQRRSGLEYNVQEAELAAHLAGQTNKAKAAMAWLIKKGFTPTQIADSFAISAGGATHYRNNVKRFLKEGMSKTAAEKKAFLEFQEATEVSQQSSRADLISQQQASGLGRTILAWANTPMQYLRIQEKAARDIVNGRGSTKESLGKIAYYGTIQSVIFAGLQNALFAWGLDEDDDMDDEALVKSVDRTVNTVIDSQLRGFGVGGAVVSALKNTILEFQKQEEKDMPDHQRTALAALGVSPVLSSKIRKLFSAGDEWNYNRDAIKEMGLDIDNPVIHAAANVVEATTNIPVARIVQKIDNLRNAADDNNQWWQRLASSVGFAGYSIGIEDTEVDEAKEAGKKKRKDAKKLIDDAEKEAEEAILEKGFIEAQQTERLAGKSTTCAGVSSVGERCSLKPLTGKTYCTIHQKVPQRSDGEKVQCSKIKSNGKRCKVKTTNQSGKCYYHD